MNDSLETVSPPYVLYSPAQVALGSFIGGPMSACWLMGENYKVLGNTQAMRSTTVWGVVATSVALGMALFMAETLPPGVLPIGYTCGLYFTAKQLQETTVQNHLAAGGALGSWWRVVAVGVVGMAVILGIAMALALLAPA
ncbi:MAG: hypothetical protein SFY80_07965 [Verrucomicrobiota bacterium]|nr:hypothetical protein [Verrucomicrobiota bacterium]